MRSKLEAKLENDLKMENELSQKEKAQNEKSGLMANSDIPEKRYHIPDERFQGQIPDMPAVKEKSLEKSELVANSDNLDASAVKEKSLSTNLDAEMEGHDSSNWFKNEDLDKVASKNMDEANEPVAAAVQERSSLKSETESNDEILPTSNIQEKNKALAKSDLPNALPVKEHSVAKTGPAQTKEDSAATPEVEEAANSQNSKAAEIPEASAVKENPKSKDEETEPTGALSHTVIIHHQRFHDNSKAAEASQMPTSLAVKGDSKDEGTQMNKVSPAASQMNVNNKALGDVQVPGAEAVKENSNTLQTQVNDDASSLNAESNNKNGKALDGPQLPTAEAVKERSLGNIENAPSAAIETNPVLKKNQSLWLRLSERCRATSWKPKNHQ